MEGLLEGLSLSDANIPDDKPIQKRRYKKAKLSDDDVRLIRQCLEERKRLRQEADLYSNPLLAQKFEVSVSIIDRIARGNAYEYVQ